MPRLDGLQVYRSSIHGYGVRTTRPFRKGDIIVVGDGVLYREDDDFDDEYSLILPPFIPNEDGSEGDSLYYDLTDQTRWINHSCEPNTEVDIKWRQQDHVAIPWWYALRNIDVGDELTYDYSFAGHLAMKCKCGAPMCRGLIVDPDEAHLVPKKIRHLLRISP